MNIKQIKAQANNDITFERGIDYYENGNVHNYKLNVTDTINIEAEVIGSLNRIYQVYAIINQNNELNEYSCECQAFKTYKGCCKHIIAVLLTYYYDIDNKPTHFEKMNIKTDKFAKKMINNYTQKNLNEVVLNNYQTVHLLPHLHLTYDNKLQLSFMIGHNRPYVLRSIMRFYLDMKENNITEYGKNLTFYHHINNFTDDSKELVKLLLNTYNEILFFEPTSLHYRSYFDERYLLVSPSVFDKFFEIYKNRELLFTKYNEEITIKFNENKPNLILSITPHENEAYLISLNIKDTLIIKGEKYQYILLDSNLYRMTNEFYENIDLLFQALKEKGSALLISHQDMSSFYVNVLDIIKDDIIINADEEILSKYKPIPLTASLYIDLENNETVSAKLKFNYGEVEFDSFDEKCGDIYRNLKEELIIRSLVNKYFELESKTLRQYIITENELIIRLYYEGIEELTKYMQVYVTESFKNIIRKAPNIKIGINVKNDLLDLEIESDLSIAEIYKILNNYRHNKKYYRFKDGSFIYLEDNSLFELAQITTGLDLKTSDNSDNHFYIAKYRSMYIDNILKNCKYIKSERDNNFKEIVRDLKNVDDTQFSIPLTLKNVLRNYQKTGFRWLKTLSYYGFGGILADDMGLGKTIQIISLIQSYIDETNNSLPSLVTCPASLVLNWELEINNFAPDLKVLTIIGAYNSRKEKLENINDYDVIITSYDYLKRDIDLYENKIFMYHIIDEAQYIKNHTTLNSRSVKQIKSNNRFALTGTPVENNLAEIWSIFDFIMPGYLYSYNKFNKEFEIPIVREENTLVLENLKRLVKPFILRRLKKEVLKELPDKTETIMYTKLEGEQEQLYLANFSLIKKEVKEKVKIDTLNKSRFMILSMLTRLRQICCDPKLYYDDYEGESAKLDMCLELINNSIASGHKILLFSQFTSMLAIIKKALEKAGITYYLLDGSTNKEERINLVKKFNTDNTNVFLISLKAGGTGLNLTSADVVIHYDPWWNVSVENQATDRTHRIGQTKKVQVYKLIAKNTIEEKIIQLQEQKRKLAEAIIVEDDGIITKMTDEEILALFE